MAPASGSLDIDEQNEGNHISIRIDDSWRAAKVGQLMAAQHNAIKEQAHKVPVEVDIAKQEVQSQVPASPGPAHAAQIAGLLDA